MVFSSLGCKKIEGKMVASRLQIERNIKRYTTTGLTAEDLRKVNMTVGMLLDIVAGAYQCWSDQTSWKQDYCSTITTSSK